MEKNKASNSLFIDFKKRAGLFFFLLLNTVLLGACATSDGPTLNYSLEDLDHAIRKDMPGGISHLSENGRTYYGNYFDPFVLDRKTNGPKDKRDFRRYRSVITVTGDRRPYTVDVVVNVDVRPHNARMPASQKYDVNVGPFITHDTSPEAEDRIYRTILKSLKDHRQNTNVIDKFSALLTI